MSHGHLADDRLLDVCLGAASTPAEQDHLAACAPCAQRRLTLVQVLDETAGAAAHEADRAFPPDRLARQQARILQRLECDGRPGRVIAFPAGQPQDRPAARSVRRSPSWVAAACAVAGLTVGLLVGQATDWPGQPVQADPDAAAQAAGQAPGSLVAAGSNGLRPAVLSDDEFLRQIELAVGSSVPALLSPLNALTPSAMDTGR